MSTMNQWRAADGTLSQEGWSQITAAIMRGSLIEGKTGASALFDEFVAAGMNPDDASDLTGAMVRTRSNMPRGNA
jgi:hypothetical protein